MVSDSLLKSKDKSQLELPEASYVSGTKTGIKLLSHRRLGKGPCFLWARVDTQEEAGQELSYRYPAQED